MTLWRRLASIFVFLGVVLSPLRATSATMQLLSVSHAASRPTATTEAGRRWARHALWHETEVVTPTYVYGARPFVYDDAWNALLADGARGLRHESPEYDGGIESPGLGAVRAKAAIYVTTPTVPAAEAAPGAYSVAFETQLVEGQLGLSRTRHFAIANDALAEARAASPELAELVPAPAGRASPPSGWVWQHATIDQGAGRAGVMQLVPKAQHTAGSPFWRLLHPLPNGGGGYSEWAIPAGAPPN